MHILLINPYYPVSETPSPPLGLAFLAGALEAAGHEVRILDLVVHPFHRDRLGSLLHAFRPDLVGATAVTMTVDHALTVLAQVKSFDPAIPTVLGGPHATFCADQLLRDYPQVDIVARGEGEHILVALATAIATRAPWAGVPGITFRNGDRIAATPRPAAAVLDDLPPPAHHRIPLGRYLALGMPVNMTTSRGCPFYCIFCAGRKMVGARVRYRHPPRVVDEMAQLSQLGFHQINLADDLFTANATHCLAVCRSIVDRGLQFRWTAFARVDTVSRHLLHAMRRAGCTAISFGVESGSPEMLKRIRKGITLDQVVQAAQCCLDCGIEPHASFILGLPGETEATLQQTVEFGRQLQAMGVNHGFHILTPFPGTDVRECVDRYDLEILTDDWRHYHANRAVVRTAAVGPEAMDAIVIDAERRFDTWLGEIARRRDAGEIAEAAAWPLVRLEHTVVLYHMMMQRVVEEMGALPAIATAADGDQQAAAALIEQAQQSLRHPPERIRAAITFAVDQGHLQPTRHAGRVGWAWREHR